MAGPSKVSIWNLALSHIGQASVESDTEDSVQADALNLVWDFARKEALRSYKWGFCTVRKALALVANYTPLEFTYAYAYPSNGLKIWKLTYDGAGEDAAGSNYKKLYDPDNNQIVLITDEEDAYVEYSYDITDTTKYDPSFVDALSHRLAASLAIPLNGTPKLAESEIIIFNGLISEAKRADSNERDVTHPNNEKSGIIDARA